MSDQPQTQQIPVQLKNKLQIALGLSVAVLAAALAFTDVSLWLVIALGVVGFGVFIAGALGASSDIKRGVRRARRTS